MDNFEEKIDEKFEETFNENFNENYNEVEHLISFISEDKSKEPIDEFDKIIYFINIIISKYPTDDEIIEKLINLAYEYKNIRQIARIIFVILFNHDLSNKELLDGNSFGKSILNDFLKSSQIENKNKEIIVKEFNFIYNEKYKFTHIIEKKKIKIEKKSKKKIEVKGGKMLKIKRKNKKK